MMLRHDSPLLTDLYQLRMLQAYASRGMNECASFEFFVRKLPECRNFLVAAGLEQVTSYLAGLRFDADELAWMRDSGLFDFAFVDALADFRFTGDVDAMAEGTVFFADEPVLRITAPLPQAQLVESRIVNLLHFQILVASKAARCVIAAQGRQLTDFGMRRAHGEEAALLSARASYLAGFDASATLAAAREFGIPAAGTMAHSFVLAHRSEADAFAHFAQCFPESAMLLIDTWDTEAGAALAAQLDARLRPTGVHLRGVRLDSGDLGALAVRVRKILDDGGAKALSIFASGNLDEHALARLVESGAPIDGFGVGTRMNTSADAPYLDCAYKLVQHAGLPCRKRSTGKAYWPGIKQVLRRRDAQGVLVEDVLALQGESLQGQPLLLPVMRGGELIAPQPALRQSRDHASAELAALPAALKGLGPAAFCVRVSQAVEETAAAADARQKA